MQGKDKQRTQNPPAQQPQRDAPAVGEQHWGRGAESALARLRNQERAKAEERRALRNPAMR